jgi:hypothetical protein
MTLTLPGRSTALGALEVHAPGDESSAAPETLEEVELLNGSVWLAGTLDRGHFRRLSDYVNHAHGRLRLHDAVIVDRGDPERRQTGQDAWVDPIDLDVIGQRLGRIGPPPEDMAIEKRRYLVTALTSSHQICGTVHVHPDADLAAFLRADDPPLIVMTNAMVTWLADGRLAAEFGVALLNRRRTFAVMPS